MPVLIWKHGKSKAEATEVFRAAIKDAGYDAAVKWDGSRLEARVGPFSSVLHVRGEVADDELVLEKCRGLVGALVLSRIRELLAGLFPGGEVTSSGAIPARESA